MANKEKLVFGVQPELPYAIEEAINRLRINISFLGNDMKRILIISSEPNEGKSFVAFNLWKQMALLNESSVLIDADMRKSTLAGTYGMTREDGKELKGTSHLLSGRESIEDAVFATDIESGDILPNVDNLVNPSMLLESQKFEEMLEYMDNHYRYTFIDAPPLGMVSDAERIGHMCDGAVLCVRSGVTPRVVVRNSIRQLERAGCPLLGFVLNRVDTSKERYYYRYNPRN